MRLRKNLDDRNPLVQSKYRQTIGIVRLSALNAKANSRLWSTSEFELNIITRARSYMH